MTDGVDSFTEDIRDHLETTKAVVLQGPPGTGKTYRAKQVAQSMGDEVYRWTQNDHHFEPDSAESANNGSWDRWKRQEDANGDDRVVWEMVQFHSGYTYEDFIRGISIDTDSDGGSGGFSDASFVSEDGILTQLATVAAHDKGPEKVVLVIDELNRGDVGSIFGEAILAIEADKRGGWPIRLKYDAPEGYDGGRTLTLPENLYIIGTMNTADESVALIDHAVRRRFRFIDVLPSEGVLHDYYKGEVPARVQRQITGLFVELSRELDLDPEYAIGHSYFMHDDAEEWVSGGEKVDRWNTELLPLLREYCRKGVLSDNPDSIQSNLKEIEEERRPYVVNTNENTKGSRNPKKWFEHGFIAGGRDHVKVDAEGSVEYPGGESSLSQIKSVADDGDIVLPRWHQGKTNQKGIIAISVVTSGCTIECFEKSDQRIDRIFKSRNTNSYMLGEVSQYENSDDVGPREHYPDGIVRVNHLFRLPCMSKLSSCSNPTKEISSQVIGSNNRENGNKNRIPGNFYNGVIEQVTDGCKLYNQGTTEPFGESIYKKCMLYQIVSYFQKEYRFSPYDLPDKYLNYEGGRLREVERQLQGMGTIHGPRNPELSVVNGSGDGPFRTRVWIPVFSDPFSIRDDELLFDGKNIHAVSRTKNRISDSFNPDKHLFRHNDGDEWAYAGYMPVKEFIQKRALEEIRRASTDKQLKILYYATLFYHRNISYISDDAMSEENSKNDWETLVEQFIPDSESVAEDSRQESYEKIGKIIASKLNRSWDSGWNYNALPKREQILPENNPLDAPLPDLKSSSSRLENESELFENKYFENIADDVSIDKRHIFGPKADDDSEDWNIVDTDDLLSKLEGLNQNDIEERDRMFNLKEVLQLELGYDKDMPKWYEKLAGEQDE